MALPCRLLSFPSSAPSPLYTSCTAPTLATQVLRGEHSRELLRAARLEALRALYVEGKDATLAVSWAT